MYFRKVRERCVVSSFRTHRRDGTIFLTRSPTVRGSCCPADPSSV